MVLAVDVLRWVSEVHTQDVLQTLEWWVFGGILQYTYTGALKGILCYQLLRHLYFEG